MAYIEFKNVVKQFDSNVVLDHISMSVEKGDLVTLLGPSGCGKSTLLRCLAGLETVSSGRILLDGTDITDLSASRRNIGMVFQQYSLFPNMNVEQNIGFGLKMMKKSSAEIRAAVRKAVSIVELEGKEHDYPANLSGGQQQRVALARAIVMEPKVLLLDEPLSAIDAKLRKALQTRIREIHKELGLTTIFVTHDQDEAMVMSDVIQLFHAGRIEQSGSPIRVYTEPVSQFAAGFMGAYNQIDGAAFAHLTGADCTSEEIIAIRPETIALAREEKIVPAVRTEHPAGTEESVFSFAGNVVGSVPRGNVLRYEILAEDDSVSVLLHADVLFRSFHIFEKGERLRLTIPQHDCLHIKKSNPEPVSVKNRKVQETADTEEKKGGKIAV